MTGSAWSSLAAGVTVLFLAGCGDEAAHGNRGGGSPARRATPVVAPLRTGPCRPTAVRWHGAPAWMRVSEVPDTGAFPYAIASGEPVAAVFFLYPLRANLPAGTRNKILWVVGLKPKAATLVISARSATPRPQRFRVRADVGGSGQIQRTLLQFPASGCWRLMLRWDEHLARLDVRVRPRRG